MRELSGNGLLGAVRERIKREVSKREEELSENLHEKRVYQPPIPASDFNDDEAATYVDLEELKTRAN